MFFSSSVLVTYERINTWISQLSSGNGQAGVTTNLLNCGSSTFQVFSCMSHVVGGRSLFLFPRLFLMPLPRTVMGLQRNEITSLVWGCGTDCHEENVTVRPLCSNSCLDGKFRSLFCCNVFRFYTCKEMCA